MRYRLPALLLVFLALPSLAQEPAPDQPVLEIYDVHDLIDEEEEVDDLVREVREIGAGGIEQLTPREGHVLVVVATKAAQLRIGEHLREVRRQRSRVITLEVRFLKLPDAGGLGLPEGRSSGPVDADHVAALLASLPAGGGGLASAPRLTCYPGQEAEIVVGRQLSYIRTFEARRVAGGIVADPVVDTARDGFFLKATPTLSVTPDSLDVDLDITLSEVAQPILTRSIVLKRGQRVPVSVQIPQVTELRLVRSATIAAGSTFGFDAGAIPFGGFGGNHLVILVTAELSTLEAMEKEK
jgi:hypothetical protein